MALLRLLQAWRILALKCVGSVFALCDHFIRCDVLKLEQRCELQLLHGAREHVIERKGALALWQSVCSSRNSSGRSGAVPELIPKIGWRAWMFVLRYRFFETKSILV